MLTNIDQGSTNCTTRVGTSLEVIAKQTLLTILLTLSCCLNSRLRKCVTWSEAPKVACFYAVQNTRKLPELARIDFLTTITTQNTLIRCKPDFWTYTTRHMG